MATKQIAWNTGSGNITLTYTGQGDGPISVQSDANDGNARSQVITIQTTKGGLVTKNVTISQAACPVPVGTVLNYAYTGSYQEVELPAGQYKLQCWGAQGGSNAAASSYGITAKAGGKGGYAEGIITLSQKTTVRVYVGGQGSSSTGGFNGGGSTTGSSTYNSGNEQGVSRMGGGGGATDIRLSNGSLYSRMIVAGGGSGGAMAYRKRTTEELVTITDASFSGGSSNFVETFYNNSYFAVDIPVSGSNTYKLTCNFTGPNLWVGYAASTGARGSAASIEQIQLKSEWASPSTYTLSLPAGTNYVNIFTTTTFAFTGATISLTHQETQQVTTTDNQSQVGYVGGGVEGGGYWNAYKGKQNAAGNGGSFGQGGNQTATNYRYCSGAGGGGWYGGGVYYADSGIDNITLMGGGSGWVNTSASSGNRPSGYTGLELDSGSTTAGSSSFPAPGGGNETGHAGNGYARITRLS